MGPNDEKGVFPGEGSEEEDEEEEFGKRIPQKKMDPKEPTPAERREHELTHIPFRSWCRHCVRGRGKEEDCRKTDRAPEIPEIHIDFMFMGEEGGKNTLPMVVVRERVSKAIMVSICLLYTSPSPRDGLLSRMPSSA